MGEKIKEILFVLIIIAVFSGLFTIIIQFGKWEVEETKELLCELEIDGKTHYLYVDKSSINRVTLYRQHARIFVREYYIEDITKRKVEDLITELKRNTTIINSLKCN